MWISTGGGAQTGLTLDGRFGVRVRVDEVTERV